MRNNYIPPEHLTMIERNLDHKYVPLVRVLVLTGYRVDDILHTRKRDWSGDEISLRERKTGSRRTVKLTPEIRDSIQKLERACGSNRKHALSYLMRSKVKRRLGKRKYTKRHIHRSTVYRKFTEAVKNAGLDGLGYTVHSLRKVYAVNKYLETGSLLEVQKDMGHKNIAVTMLYAFSNKI